jgi:hypothetical protein
MMEGSERASGQKKGEGTGVKRMAIQWRRMT